MCRAPTEHAHRPFCSRRCADLDLAQWLGSGYVISGGTADADEDGEAAHVPGASVDAPDDSSDDA